jgi:hypothetical protein
MEKFNYCDFDSNTVIKSILQNAFTIDHFTSIEKAYEDFKHCFEDESYQGRVQTIERKNFTPQTSDTDFLNKFPDSQYTIGVDLPVAITDSESYNGKCVFIVGEDALRKNESNPDIILSTPFATHWPKYRNSHGKLYWKFSVWLMEKGYKIYYTDLKKVWIKKQSESRKLAVPDDLLIKFKECLKAEIGEFKPEIIITFGKEAGD